MPPTKPITRPEENPIPTMQRIIAVLWPSFITASIATIIFFTLFDPVELAQLLGIQNFDRLGGYTIGFFAFWVLTSISCTLTCYFRRPCH